MADALPPRKRVAILGAGPSGLFLFKHLLEAGSTRFAIDIFESKSELGSGMPYSLDGASTEHITNVSCDEIPRLVTPILEWLETLPPDVLDTFKIDIRTFHEHKVLPRLLFGEYLANQFALLLDRAQQAEMPTVVHYGAHVSDVIDQPEKQTVLVEIASETQLEFDYVVICTGHNWPHAHEGRIPGYFDSPYPPSKLAHRYNHRVAIRGSSLTAVDAIRTLARCNGTFLRDEHHGLRFEPNEESPDFRIVMHSRSGLLPCVRFHTDTPEIGQGLVVSESAMAANMARNDGFLSLDFVFEMNFKQPLRDKDPDFYARIKDMRIEEFVDAMLGMREDVDPFAFFKGEYAEAAKSIRRRESIHWKEMLSALSFAMNYPAKHMSAEDMLRHRQVLMPLISIVIAFVPQSSCEELIALHDDGRLDLIAVGDDSTVEPMPGGGITYHYQDESGVPVNAIYETFIDCIGQPHLSLDAFPFQSLVVERRVIPALLQFRSNAVGEAMEAEGSDAVEQKADGTYYLRVPGMAITDDFQIVGTGDIANPRIYMMAVPYIGGYNPDYSGLDFCEEAGGLVAHRIMDDYESRLP